MWQDSCDGSMEMKDEFGGITGRRNRDDEEVNVQNMCQIEMDG